jgi:hypothetical protein
MIRLERPVGYQPALQRRKTGAAASATSSGPLLHASALRAAETSSVSSAFCESVRYSLKLMDKIAG